MKIRSIGEKCLLEMKNQGVEKAEYIFSQEDKTELNFTREINLLRTTSHKEVELTAIKNNKKSTMILNDLSEENLEDIVRNLVVMCESSKADESNDIAKMQEAEEFYCGKTEADVEKMYYLVDKLLKDCKELFPQLIFNESYLYFSYVKKQFINSNGVDFKINKGVYTLSLFYASKDGKNSASFNGMSFVIETLPNDLLEYENVKKRLSESVEQIYCKSIGDKFLGSIIITPDCLSEFVNYYNELFLKDMSLITSSSILADKLNKKVASEKLTITCAPVGKNISDKIFITKDGIKAENNTYIENGILKNFLLSIYAGNVLDLKSIPTVEILVVKAGDKKLEQIIREMDRGIIINRFSGGMPAANGDFSGVAKNSYYIEDGEVKYPIMETMISGNLYEMFNNIEDISSESTNMGYTVLPWVKTSRITISGK